MSEESGKCAICGLPYGCWGNNPAPILTCDERVCDICNDAFVIPVRLGAKAKLTLADGRTIEIK